MSMTIYADTGYASGAFNPRAPFPVLVRATATSLSLDWGAVPGAVGYSIYAGVRDDAMVPVELDTDLTSFDLTALDQPGYAAKIIADMGGGSSVASYLVRSGIAAVQAVSITLGSGEATLEFDAVPGAVGYNIYYGPSAASISSVPLPQRDIPGAPWAQQVDGGFVVKGLPDGQPYFFVQAVYKDCIAVSTGGTLMPQIFPWMGANTHVGNITSTVVGNVVDLRSVSAGDVAPDTEVHIKMRTTISGTNDQKFLRIALPSDPTNALLVTIPQGAVGAADLEFILLANGGAVNFARMTGRLNNQMVFAYSRSTVSFNASTTDWDIQSQAWVANALDSIAVDSVAVTTILPTTQV